MCIGELIFYYQGKSPVVRLYLGKVHRDGLLLKYADADGYDMVPFDGCGMPHLINRKKKVYAQSIESAATITNIKPQSLNKQLLVQKGDWKYRHQFE